MKNILYGLLATLLFSNFSFAQLMSDGDHRVMMDTYTTNLNNVLTAQLAMVDPSGNTTLDQFKRGIINGSFTVAGPELTSIINYAAPLKAYGIQFMTTNGLNGPADDAYKYFYSTFAPSTVVQNGKLVESTSGLTATEMWTCALSNFGTTPCGSSAIVSDKYDLYTLANTSVSKLDGYYNDIPGVLVMLGGFSDCLSVISVANDVMAISSFLNENQSLIDTNFTLLSQASPTDLIPYMQRIGFQDVQSFSDRLPRAAANAQKFMSTANYQMSVNHLATADGTPIVSALQRYVEGTIIALQDKRCNDGQAYPGADDEARGNHCGTSVLSVTGTATWDTGSGEISRDFGIVKIHTGYMLYYDSSTKTNFRCGCGKNGGNWDWFWE